MTAQNLRQKYLEFFKSKGHAIIPSASLIPENDPTVLFTTAGMHPLVPYLLGERHPAGSRLADVQKCIRTSDIDEVGDNRHLTFFEMLGNWSLGDYFKKEAIEWSWEFLTDKNYLALDPKRIYVTVFMGDKNAPEDQESISVWKSQFAASGIPAEICEYGKSISGSENYRIFTLPAKDNWWGPAGQTGPCGPCTEMFYDVAPQNGPLKKTFDEEVAAGRIMEVWNDVFMEFNKTASGQFEKLAQKNVDTGMGVERTVAVLNGRQNVFETEVFAPLFEKIKELSGKEYGESDGVTKAMRVIADHLRAASFILGDNKAIAPSNVDQGYIIRRLIRRAVRYGRQIGINDIFTFKVAESVIEIYKDIYPELKKNKEFIVNQLVGEEEKFSKTIGKGLVVLNRELKAQIGVRGQSYKPQPIFLIKDLSDSQILDYMPAMITGKWLFDFYQTLGFPPEMIFEELKARKYPITLKDCEKLLDDFNKKMKEHRGLSRAGAEQKFKGGLADNSEQVIKYHTAAHLALAAMRKVLGSQVAQKGANITAERLRFDFSYPQKLTLEEIKQIEEIINEKIQADLPVIMEEMGLEEAKISGATGSFESRYGERVKVYSIADKSGEIFSKEICGGPHAERTGILGKFKIIKEESSSAGVRRIKAVLG